MSVKPLHCFNSEGLWPPTQRSSHQSSGQTEDGEEGAGRGEGGVFADSGFFPHLYISSSDVISQGLRHDRLPLLTQSDVSPEGTGQVLLGW